MKAIFLPAMLTFGFLASVGQPGTTLSVKTYRTDLAFNCITVDSANDIWAGTSGKGLIKVSNGAVTPIVLTTNSFDKVIIKGLAADGVNGIWVAHEGFNGSVASFGGVDFLKRLTPSNKLHYASIILSFPNNNKGLPSRRTESIGIDKNGKVWTSHTYHDLTVIGGNPSYLVYPGGVGVKTPAMTVFDTVATGLAPYPAYTVNTPVTQTAGTRVCPSLGIGNTQNEVWVGVASYNAFPFQNSRICKWNLAGNYLGEINETNSPLPLGAPNGNPRVTAILFDPKRRVWVGFNQGKGIAVKLDTGWAYAGRPGIMPAGAMVNQNAIAGNSKGEVFIGTTAGLLKYKGRGAFHADTSYVFYTTANNLPNNNITGVVIDKTGAIWIATSAGIAKMRDGDLMVYNLRSSAKDTITGNEDYRVAIASYNSGWSQEAIDKDTLFIAADGSKSTVLKYMGSNPNNIKFRIQEDANGQHPGEYGSFLIKYRTAANDSIRVQYHHPDSINRIYTNNIAFNGRMATLELVDTTTSPEVVVLSKKIKFLLPPVLLVHGIWSSGEDSWNKSMVPFLQGNGIYNYDSRYISAISYPNDKHFNENSPRIPGYIEELIEKSRSAGFSAGKVDVLCHSMGGILTRLYLENKNIYRNNINKLITLNTPHSGSPLANIVEASSEITQWLLKMGGKNPYNGALGDLAIGKPPIDNLLNGPTRDSANGVPVAVVYTSDNASVFAEAINQLITVKSFNTLKRFYSKNYFAGAIGAAHFALLCLKLDLLKTTPCADNTTLNDCMNMVYNGPSDWIVSAVSQKGGVASAAYYFDQINHLNVHAKLPVQNKVLDLLRADAGSASFTTGGFHPARLRWVPGTGTVQDRGQRPGSETITIVSPAAGNSYSPNDSVEIKIKASAGIRNAVIYIDYSNGFSAFAIYPPDSVFAFRIPEDAAGRMDYKIIGIDNTGNTTADSSYINILQSPGVVLDSIHIERNDNQIIIEKDDSTDFILWGYYSGQKRFISQLPGISFIFETGGIASPGLPYTLKGLATGFDFLKITFGGKSDSTYIQVIPKINVDTISLPITLSSFSGRFISNAVTLSWITGREENNMYFDIELSYDGIHFSNIGRIAGKGNSARQSIYNFTDATAFKTGRNYYRLRQTDVDGKSTFSSIVVINISPSGKLLATFYPNPAAGFINMDISQYQGGKYTMQLVNAAGNRIFSVVLNGGQNRISLPASITPGLYIINLIGSDGRKLTNDKLVIR